jgi:hypothetical protein
MFQIFDCNGQAVGNPKGYRTHRGAQAQCERTGKIRTAIFTAHHLKEWPLNGIKHLYSIRWVDPVAVAIVQRTGVPAGRLIVSHVRG